MEGLNPDAADNDIEDHDHKQLVIGKGKLDANTYNVTTYMRWMSCVFMNQGTDLVKKARH